MQAGVYKDLDIEKYHSTSGISRSGLMEFRRSPSHYWNAYHNPNRPPKEPTEAMIFGNAFHTFILEPHTFNDRYAIYPEGLDRRTKDGKAEYELFNANNKGKTVLTAKHLEQLEAMKESIQRHPQASDLINDALYEQSLFWNDPHTGVLCKTRPDIWHANMTVDLKTIISADERTFTSAMMMHGYHIQSAMNRQGILETGGDDIKTHVFLCVEKTFPFSVAVYILDIAVLDFAHMSFKNLITDYKQSVENNAWPSYATKTIFLPKWAESL